MLHPRPLKINRASAAALKLTIPPEVLIRADEIVVTSSLISPITDGLGFPLIRSRKAGSNPDALTSFTSVTSPVPFAAASWFVPTMYYDRGYIEQGGLMSFTMYPGDRKSRLVHLIADIFEGAKPAEMPWELPDRVYLAINLRTAGLLGLKLPSDMLVRAAQVVE